MNTQFQSLVHVSANYPPKDAPLEVPKSITIELSPPRTPIQDDAIQSASKMVTTTQGDGGKISVYHANKSAKLLVHLENELILTVDDVLEYTLIPTSNLFDKKTVVACITQPENQKLELQTYLIDGDTRVSYQLNTLMEIPADMCEEKTQSQTIYLEKEF